MLLQSGLVAVSGPMLAAGPETAFRNAKDKALRKVLPRRSKRLASAVSAEYNSADSGIYNMLRSSRRPGSAKNRSDRQKAWTFGLYEGGNRE